MTRLLAIMLAAGRAAPLVTAALIPSAGDDLACGHCIDLAQKVTNCASVVATEPAIDCLCKPVNTEHFYACSNACKDTPGLLPASLCNNSAPAAGEIGRLTLVEKQLCALCWETAVNQAYDPLCIHTSGKAATECLCKPGNIENFFLCNKLCINVPGKQPVDICPKAVTVTDSSTPHSSGASFIAPTTLITAAPPSSFTWNPHNPAARFAKVAKGTKSLATHRSMGSYLGPCGPLGNACRVAVTSGSVTFTPLDVITTTIDGGVYQSTQYAALNDTPVAVTA